MPNMSYAWSIVDHASVEFTQLLAGSDREERAAEFYAGEFGRLGLTSQVLRFNGLVSDPAEGALVVLDGTQSRTVTCNAFAHGEPIQDLEADLVHVGAGGWADYEGVDASGRIVVVELSYAPPRPEKVRIARLQGAVGVIMINWGADTDIAVPKGTVKSVWGNPTRDDRPAISTLPAVGISRPDGVVLVEELRAGRRLRARLSTTTTRGWRQLRMPMAWTGDGIHARDGFVLVAGHYDSWGGSVTDNVCSNAGMLAIAETVAAMEDRRREVVFVFWSGHESGIMSGSTWFNDAYWDALRHNCVAHVNVDGIGIAGNTVWSAKVAAEMRGLVRSEGLPRDTIFPLRPTKTGDHSFFGAGIPSLDCRSAPTEEKKTLEHGATLGWWYHSDHDTLDKLDPDYYARDLSLIERYVTSLITTDLLPHRLGEVAQEIDARLAELTAMADARGVDLDRLHAGWTTLRAASDRFGAACERFDHAVSEMRELGEDARAGTANAAMVAVSRLTIPARYTAVAEQEQDSYGQSRLGDVLPCLTAVAEYATADDEEREFILTEVMRGRNRVADALRAATDVLDEALDELES